MLKACVHGADNRQKRDYVLCAERRKEDTEGSTGREMSYVEYLISYLLLACGLVGSAMFLIGWLVMKLIDSKWDIGGK